MVDETTEIDEYIDQRIQATAQNYALQMGNYPEPPNKDSLLQFVRDVVAQENAKKLSKTANFRDEEVGKPKAPVLTYLQVAHYAEAENYSFVSEYLQGKVGNVAIVGLGRKAKLMEILFTVRRENRTILPQKKTTERGLFGGEKKVVTEGGVES